MSQGITASPIIKTYITDISPHPVYVWHIKPHCSHAVYICSATHIISGHEAANQLLESHLPKSADPIKCGLRLRSSQECLVNNLTCVISWVKLLLSMSSMLKKQTDYKDVLCPKDIWQGSLEWLEQGFYQLENLEREKVKYRKTKHLLSKN